MPLFTYTDNIPDGPNNPSQDQPNMKTNTNSIDQLLAVDHFSFNDGNGGLHKQVNLVTEASPALQGNSVIYANTYQGRVVPWAKNSSDDLPLFFRVSNSNPGFSSTYGATIYQFGTVTPVVNQTLTAVSFPLAFPNSCFVVVVTAKRTASPNGVDQIYVNAKTASNFSYYATTSGTGFASFDWIAIGF